MATQKPARPTRAGTSKAAKATATRKSAAASAATEKSTKRGTTAKAPAKKAAAKTAKTATPRKAAASKKASPARKSAAAPAAGKSASPRTRKAAASAGPDKTPRAPRRAKAELSAEARLRKLVIDALDDLKAKDVVEIDVRGKSGVTDLLVVASGTSSRHVKSIADEVVKQAKHAGMPPIGVEGQREAEWVLVDLGDVIVHVMLPRTREFYGLERLWTVGDVESEPLAG